MPHAPITPDALREAYFARVAPLYGTAWDGVVLGLGDDPFAREVALLLARCGLRRFATASGESLLRRALAAQNPHEPRYEVSLRGPRGGDALWFYGPAARRPSTAKGWCATQAWLEESNPVRARVDFFRPGEALASQNARDEAEAQRVTRAELALRVAALVRGWLLKDTDAAPAEGPLLLAPLNRPTVLLGHARWPWWLRACEREDADAYLYGQRAVTPQGRRRPGGRVLVVGCGSVGSLTVDAAAEDFDEWILMDPEPVSPENPVRQAFEVCDAGRPKVEALAERLYRRGVRARGEVLATEDSRAGGQAFGALLDAWRPDVALLATGTGAEYAMAEALRRRGIPHVAARCYARARYYEIIAVDGARGPCFHCLRERVHAGPAPALTPEQQLRYDPAYRPGELNAEPATVLESGRCALAAARVLSELALPAAARAAWLEATLAQERTCLIGGNHAELARDAWAYGVDRPGAVVSYGLEDLAGVAPGERCEVCGKLLAADG